MVRLLNAALFLIRPSPSPAPADQGPRACRIHPAANGTWKAGVCGDAARASTTKELKKRACLAGRVDEACQGTASTTAAVENPTVFELDVFVSLNIFRLRGVIMKAVEWDEVDAKFTEIQFSTLVHVMRLKNQNITFLILFYVQNTTEYV